MDRRGAIPHNPNNLDVPSRKSNIKAWLGLLVIAAGVSAAVFNQALNTPDYSNDPGVVQAIEAALNNEQFFLKQTEQAREFNIGGSGELSENSGLCAIVPEGGTVSGAVLEANGEVFPPFEYRGKPVYVSVRDINIITILPLAEVMAGGVADKVQPGATVCVDDTGTKPTPTPQSLIPSMRLMV